VIEKKAQPLFAYTSEAPQLNAPKREIGA
jgi:hypothetical protein